MVSRLLAVLLIPLYTSYLSPDDYGKVGILTAWSAVLVIALRAGISTAFFRFYFDAEDDRGRTTDRPHLLLVHDGDGDGGADRRPRLRRADLAGVPRCRAGTRRGHLRRRLGADELRAADLALPGRAARRSRSGSPRSRTSSSRSARWCVFVAVFHWHALGLIVGNFTGTLTIYLVLLAYRRYQLGLEFDRHLLREMNRFGLPLVPSALALWAINFVDRFLITLARLEERGRRLHDRDPDLLGDRLPALRVPHGLARLRLLDQGRRRGEADLRVRPHLPDAPHLLDLDRALASSRRGSSTC